MSEWRRVDASIKALHMVGRTRRIGSPVSAEECEAMEEQYGTTFIRCGRPPMSITQRLDLVATNIIRLDTATRTVQRQHSDVLSVWSAGMRAERELPYEDMDSTVEKIVEHDRDFLRSRRWYGNSVLVRGNRPVAA